MWMWIVNVVLNGALANGDNTTNPITTSSEFSAKVDSSRICATDAPHQSDIEVHIGRSISVKVFLSGAVPGELAFGRQLQFSLMRPLAYQLFRWLYWKMICALFDLDGVQYQAATKNYDTDRRCCFRQVYLSNFQARQKSKTGLDLVQLPKFQYVHWHKYTNKWFSECSYKDGRKDLKRGPGRIYVHLGPNEWTLRANINKRSTTLWNASCDVDETIEVKPFSEMLEALTKQ